MQKWCKAARAAFPVTVPVLFGYVFMGAAFGFLLSGKGYGAGWALLMSACIYAGSMQFLAVGLLSAPFDPFGAALMTLMINARHLFYGLSMLDRFRIFGKRKPYMIFSLTDETYSLLCAAKVPQDVEERDYLFCISLLDQSYWVAGSVLGGLLGSAISFNTKGIDFVMTALFVVIFTEQWLSAKNHFPALAGFAGSLLCLILFGPSNFVIPSMAVILVLLSLLRKPMERGAKA